MGKKLDLNYFTGQEADQFNFIKIPKPLLYDPIYADLKIAEVITYSRMLDRMNLSIKNGWFDELGRAYIFCSLKDVQEFADCGKNKAVDILKALEAIGLIEKVKGAPGMGTRIYVKNFIPKERQKFTNQTFGSVDFETERENDNVDKPTDVCFSNSENPENQTSMSPENKLTEVWKSNSNNNKYNNTNPSNTKSIRIIPSKGYLEMQQAANSEIRMDEIGYAELIKDNIELDSLKISHPYDTEFLDGVYDLILETVLCKTESIVVASNEYSTNFVRGKLLKLNSSHIEYVLGAWKKNANKPRNVKKYLLAALFNAPTTIDAFYTAEYNHDVATGVFYRDVDEA